MDCLRALEMVVPLQRVRNQSFLRWRTTARAVAAVVGEEPADAGRAPRCIVEHPRDLLRVAAKINDQRVAIDMPGMQPYAVGGVDENAFHPGPAREGGAAGFLQPLRMEDEAVLRDVRSEERRV